MLLLLLLHLQTRRCRLLLQLQELRLDRPGVGLLVAQKSWYWETLLGCQHCLLVLLPRSPPLLLCFGVWVQASWNLGSLNTSSLAFTKASLMSTAVSFSSMPASTSSSGRTSLTDLVDLQIEHHSVRWGLRAGVNKVGGHLLLVPGLAPHELALWWLT